MTSPGSGNFRKLAESLRHGRPWPQHVIKLGDMEDVADPLAPADDGEPPAGHAGSWVQTLPGKGFFLMLRLYGPLEPWFDGTWRPGEIEAVDLS